jgi:hypothetical protein
MKYRRLRIPWSVCCGILCLLLIVFWVRSWRAPGRILIVRSQFGTVMTYSATGRLIGTATTKSPQAKPLAVWLQSNGGTRISDPPVDFIIYPELGFAWGSVTNCSYALVPYWFPLAVLATLGVLPWLPWRFSLRTLLIAMTVVAAILGLVIWAAG